jgi:hypothetical protein
VIGLQFSSSTLLSIEPTLVENPSYFVLFLIQGDEARTMVVYKKVQASIWIVEEIYLSLG